MRRRWRLLIAACAVVVVAPLAGALIPSPLFAPERDRQGPQRRMLVLANPIHTDIALPADADVVARFGFLADADLPLFDPGVKWIVVGWGGREFYLETPNWSDLKLGPLARALTVDRAVMHVTMAGDIDQGAGFVSAIDLSPAEFDRVVEASLSDFVRDPAGKVRLIEDRSYGLYDRFYEASGRFTALRGCNTWTGALLREGGLRTGLWNPLPQSLVWSLEAFNELP